ncbi:hypothetical protein [Xylophilus ampelinus]|uniref:hypothetical protein n=1 Tax=Xylophilus ampelinus TaxID=54067 RepID=UPI001314ACE7|nr:hypothetical protein [Xylophilus ampelinus]MCS4508696.1 hypothetical protein [Xylophilus ampelinus]
MSDDCNMRYSNNHGKIFAKRSFSALVLMIAATLSGAAYAKVIGQVVVVANVSEDDSRSPHDAVSNQHWGKAYDNCRQRYPATVSVYMTNWEQKSQQPVNGGFPITSYWDCRNS